MSKSSDLGWWICRNWQPCNCLRMPEARRFQESRMPGNPLVRFDEGRVGRTAKVSPSLLLYRLLPAADDVDVAVPGPKARLVPVQLALQLRKEPRRLVVDHPNGCACSCRCHVLLL